MPSSGSCAVLGKPLSVANTFRPLLKIGAHHSSALGCGRIKEMTHGKCLAQSLVLDEQEILPLTLFPIAPCPAIPRSQHPQTAFSLMALCSLDLVKRG